MKHEDIIGKLSLEEKCALLQGGTTFGSWGIERAGIPAIEFSDGPNGVRHQAGRRRPPGPQRVRARDLLPHRRHRRQQLGPRAGRARRRRHGARGASQGVDRPSGAAHAHCP